jgi:hypothetical protein
VDERKLAIDFVKDLCTDSILLISFLKYGDQITDENSNRGRTKVQKARVSSSVSRDKKHFKIHLVLLEAFLHIKDT